MNSKNQSSDPNKGENMATTPSTTDFGLDKITDPAIKTKSKELLAGLPNG
jgi:hypothetical protein